MKFTSSLRCRPDWPDSLAHPLQALAELRLDPRAEPLESHGDRALAHAHAHGDLARRERSLEIEEPHRLLFRPVAQAVDHLADGAQLGLFFQMLRGGRDVVLDELRLARRFLRRLEVRGARSEVAAGAVARDGEEPGRKTLAVLERGERAEGAHEGLL